MSEDHVFAPLLTKRAVACPLAEAEVGRPMLVAGLVGGQTAQTRLISLGFALGRELTIVQNNGGRVIVSLNGHRIALGQGMSQKILVVPITALFTR